MVKTAARPVQKPVAKPAAKAAAKPAAKPAPAPVKAPVKAQAKPVARKAPPPPQEEDVVDEGEAEHEGYAEPEEGHEADPSQEISAEEGDDEIINMSEIDTSGGGDYELLPRGKYPVIVDEAEFSFAKKTGNPMITLRLEVSEGEYANRKLWHRLVLTKKNLQGVKRELERIGQEMPEDGITYGQLKQWFRDVADSGNLIGAEVVAVVKQSTYEGEPRNEVRSLLSKTDTDDVTNSGDNYVG